MGAFTKALLVANVFLVYLITLSWPEILFWNKVLAEFYQEFSNSYLFELVFGGIGVMAFLGLTRSKAFNALNSSLGVFLQVIGLAVLVFVNSLGFALPISTSVSFAKINLSGFKDAGLIAQWVRDSADVAPQGSESDRTQLFAYAFLRELKRNNLNRSMRAWYFVGPDIIGFIRPFELCVPQYTQYRCLRKNAATSDQQDWLSAIRNRHTELDLSGDVSIVDEASGRVFRIAVQCNRISWRGGLPSVYFEKTVDLPTEALTEVFRWVGSQGGFIMPAGIAASPQELEYAKTIFFGRSTDLGGLTSYEYAEQVLAQKLKAAPDDPGYNFLLGTAEIYTGRWVESEQHLKKALQLAPESKQYIAFQLGLLAYYKGSYLEAAGYYAEVKSAGEKNLDVWARENLWWARDRFALATWRAAQRDAQSSRRIFSRENFTTAVELAEVNFEQSLRDAPKVGPTLVHFHVAQFYSHLGEFGKAISGYQGVDSLYSAAAERVDGLVRSEVQYRQAESLRNRGNAFWSQALEKYLEAIRAGQCGSIENEKAKPKKSNPPENLGTFSLGNVEICVGASYPYSNLQPLAQYLLMSAERITSRDQKTAEAQDAAVKLTRLWTANDEQSLTVANALPRISGSMSEGKPRFFPDIKVEFFSVLGNLCRIAGDEQTAEAMFRLSLKAESSLFNGENRPIDVHFPDGRLGLARVLVSRLQALDRNQTETSRLYEELRNETKSHIEEGIVYAIPNSALDKQLRNISSSLD